MQTLLCRLKSFRCCAGKVARFDEPFQVTSAGLQVCPVCYVEIENRDCTGWILDAQVCQCFGFAGSCQFNGCLFSCGIVTNDHQLLGPSPVAPDYACVTEIALIIDIGQQMDLCFLRLIGQDAGECFTGSLRC